MSTLTPLPSMAHRQNWIAVASENHVRIGQEGGFMQVCHGKERPLCRIRPNDCVIYYSPTTVFGGKDKCQAFTAIGLVKDTPPYPFDMGNGFIPYRRDVLWLFSENVPIHPLLDRLDFTVGVHNWGYRFRYGLFSISEHDSALIATAMNCRISQETMKD